MLPKSISASGYGSLLACPYQFHARYLLGLGEVDEVEEEVEKVHYGMLVHSVLSDFHRLHPRVSELASDEAQRRLAALSEHAFEAHIAWDYQTAAWLARWLALVPDYIKWQRDREAQGWQFVAGEADKAIGIVTPQGRSFVLRGRIDRADRNAAGAVALVDYKTGEAKPLETKLETPGEDVQLPVYAALWGGEVAAALFLSVGREDVLPVELQADVMALATATRMRLEQVYDEIAAGARLPAQGDEQTCEYCEQRGLCRKGYWLERLER
jgi:ATP-dependent helicase/nuclease subunit B